MTWLAFEKFLLGGQVEKPKGLEARRRGENSRLGAGREIKAQRVEKPPVKAHKPGFLGGDPGRWSVVTCSNGFGWNPAL